MSAAAGRGGRKGRAMRGANLLRAALLALAALAPAGAARAGESLFGVTSAGISYGPYVRAELGAASSDISDGYWLPPNHPEDPKVFFDLDGGNPVAGSVAAGFDWMNGLRADLSVTSFGRQTVDGSWSRTDPPDDRTHADVSAKLSSVAVMLNGTYSPLERMGRNSRLQPFVTAGLGLAFNDISEWERTNPDSDRPVRAFRGRTTTSVAWSLGAGISWQAAKLGGRPVMVEATYRYFDLGSARGRSVPQPGNGNSQPVRPLTFDPHEHLVTLGIRIPLRSY